MIHVLIIPGWTPVLTNHWYGRHWRTRHRLHKRQTEALSVYASLVRIPGATSPRKVRVVCHGWKSGRLPDPDGADKLLRDSLRDSGLVIDDDLEHMPEFRVEFVRAKEKRTVITLEDCD